MHGLERTIFKPKRVQNFLVNIFNNFHKNSTSSFLNHHISDHCGPPLKLNNVDLNNSNKTNNKISHYITSPKTVINEDIVILII